MTCLYLKEKQNIRHGIFFLFLHMLLKFTITWKLVKLLDYEISSCWGGSSFFLFFFFNLTWDPKSCYILSKPLICYLYGILESIIKLHKDFDTMCDTNIYRHVWNFLLRKLPELKLIEEKSSFTCVCGVFFVFVSPPPLSW